MENDPSQFSGTGVVAAVQPVSDDSDGAIIDTFTGVFGPIPLFFTAHARGSSL